ncbi:hypothetical protein [Bacillus pumilus]|uniref:hypothetical protein n=1 Tax=Bacillus pumilus TaxID=1408 RepID=UPI000D037C32|nr:hypothetical protein [Bacillus pumilus]PRS14632.1 hypothetical protein C6X95_06545 [Bacillus pumilus]
MSNASFIKSIKGSMLNAGQSSFEAYPAVEIIKLNTGEEEVIQVEEGTNELNQKGDRLDFFFVGLCRIQCQTR